MKHAQGIDFLKDEIKGGNAGVVEVKVGRSKSLGFRDSRSYSHVT